MPDLQGMVCRAYLPAGYTFNTYLVGSNTLCSSAYLYYAKLQVPFWAQASFANRMALFKRRARGDALLLGLSCTGEPFDSSAVAYDML